MCKLADNDQLRQYVQDRLAGTVRAPDGSEVEGPQVRWIGRRHWRRQDQRVVTRVSAAVRMPGAQRGPSTRAHCSELRYDYCT
jgi:hypothetical protein